MLHAAGTPDCPCRPDRARAYATQLQIIPIKRRGQRGLCIHHNISTTRRMIVAHQEKHERKFSRVSFPRVAGTNSHVRDVVQRRTTLIFAADNYTSSPPDLDSADFICRPVPPQSRRCLKNSLRCLLAETKALHQAYCTWQRSDACQMAVVASCYRKKPRELERRGRSTIASETPCFSGLWLRSYASRFGNGGHRERMRRYGTDPNPQNNRPLMNRRWLYLCGYSKLASHGSRSVGPAPGCKSLYNLDFKVPFLSEKTRTKGTRVGGHSQTTAARLPQ